MPATVALSTLSAGLPEAPESGAHGPASRDSGARAAIVTAAGEEVNGLAWGAGLARRSQGQGRRALRGTQGPRSGSP